MSANITKKSLTKRKYIKNKIIDLKANEMWINFFEKHQPINSIDFALAKRLL